MNVASRLNHTTVQPHAGLAHLDGDVDQRQKQRLAPQQSPVDQPDDRWRPAEMRLRETIGCEQLPGDLQERGDRGDVAQRTARGERERRRSRPVGMVRDRPGATASRATVGGGTCRRPARVTSWP